MGDAYDDARMVAGRWYFRSILGGEFQSFPFQRRVLPLRKNPGTVSYNSSDDEARSKSPPAPDEPGNTELERFDNARSNLSSIA
jgi:hypothetical protein